MEVEEEEGKRMVRERPMMVCRFRRKEKRKNKNKKKREEEEEIADEFTFDSSQWLGEKTVNTSRADCSTRH